MPATELSRIQNAVVEQKRLRKAAEARANTAEAALSIALRSTEAASSGVRDGWRDDPSTDERWNAGADFVMGQLCDYLGVDQSKVTWDAATETLDGDVKAVLGNILRERYGENGDPRSDAAEASYWAVHSKTGMHIGLWPNKSDADEALREYDGGRITALFASPIPQSAPPEPMSDGRFYAEHSRAQDPAGYDAMMASARDRIANTVEHGEYLIMPIPGPGPYYFEFQHSDYDPENNDLRHGYGSTVDDCKQQIADLEFERSAIKSAPPEPSGASQGEGE